MIDNGNEFLWISCSVDCERTAEKTDTIGQALLVNSVQDKRSGPSTVRMCTYDNSVTIVAAASNRRQFAENRSRQLFSLIFEQMFHSTSQWCAKTISNLRSPITINQWKKRCHSETKRYFTSNCEIGRRQLLYFVIMKCVVSTMMEHHFFVVRFVTF